MLLTDRLSQPQKVVVVIALGMAFGAAGAYLAGLGNTAAVEWSSSPFTQAGFFTAHTRLHGWQRLLIWLALIGVWALLSVRVLRPSPEQ